MTDPPIELYSDSFRFTVSPYGVALTFGLTEAHPSEEQPPVAHETVTVRMSLEQAKVLTMLFQRNLKQYERENELEIALPSELYSSLGLAAEDWQDGSATR